MFIIQHEEDYKNILESVKGETGKERVLASDMVARFFKHFPNLADQALEAIEDLCPDDDVDVRKRASMALVKICRDCKEYVPRVTDILIQLLQSKDQSEINLVNQSLKVLLDLDIMKFLNSFFLLFTTSDGMEDESKLARERALKFLSTRLPIISSEIMTKEVEDLIMTSSKKAMEDVTKDEFLSFIDILSKLKMAKTVQGQGIILESISAQIEFDKDVDLNDVEAIDGFLLCSKNALPLFSQYNRASKYVNYICSRFLPNLATLAPLGKDLDILQALAELSPFILDEKDSSVLDVANCQNIVFQKLLEYLHLPPDTENNIEEQTTDESAKVQKKQPDFLFTHIEYLMFTFHQLGRINPEFFTPQLQKEIRLRLQYLAQRCQNFTDKLSELLKAVKNSDDLRKEENKLRQVALRTIKNITIMVRDLFKLPPQFKAQILLSCKPLTTRPADAPAPAATTKPAQPTPRPRQNFQGGFKNKYHQSYNQKNDRQKKMRYNR